MLFGPKNYQRESKLPNHLYFTSPISATCQVKILTWKLWFYALLLLVSGSIMAHAQVARKTIVHGVVTDSRSKEPVPFADVMFEGTSIGTTTGTDGSFTIEGVITTNRIGVSSIGYEPMDVVITVGAVQTIKVLLNPRTVELDEVVVTEERKRYRNRDNPAVELIRNVISHRDQNRSQNLDFLAYDKYDKTWFALSGLSDDFISHNSGKKLGILFSNVDSTQLKGAKTVPFYMKEQMSECYLQNSPKRSKEIIRADKMVDFDRYLNRQGMADFMEYMFQHFDIYDNTLTFVTNVFLSPVAATAPAFYKYFIEDTVQLNGTACIRLLFTPRNKEDMLFNGFLYVANDSSYAVAKAELSVNKHINQNWVRHVRIVQEFGKTDSLKWLLASEEMAVDFGVTEKSGGIFGKRTTLYSNYRVNQPIPDSVFAGQAVARTVEASSKDDDFWEAERPAKLSGPEKGIYTLTDTLNRMPAFNRLMNVAMILNSGYIDAGKVEIGPVGTFYSYNPIQGGRPRFGGRTTPMFSNRLNFDGSVGYGLTDKKLIYDVGSTLSLTKNNIYHFPVKSVRLNATSETSIPGQELQFIQEDNVLLSVRRGVNDQLFYNRSLKIEHLNEFENHFSYSVGFSYQTLMPGGSLSFMTGKAGNQVTEDKPVNTSEAYLNLRFAPHEKFYQAKQFRTPITNKYPIINVNLTAGSSLFGNDFNYGKLKVNIFKRFYPGILGYSDVILEAGKIFGTVPYPLLYMHRANQTYVYQIASYNLMNFLEFVSDRYVSLNIDHHFNGFIFNKIPITKKLRWREVISGKILYGSLSDNNNPDINTALFRFPVDGAGKSMTYTLEKEPYIEVGAGIENIFRMFRIDLVRRLSYMGHPNVNKYGIRVKFRFDY